MQFQIAAGGFVGTEIRPSEPECEAEQVVVADLFGVEVADLRFGEADVAVEPPLRRVVTRRPVGIDCAQSSILQRVDGPFAVLERVGVRPVQCRRRPRIELLEGPEEAAEIHVFGLVEPGDVAEHVLEVFAHERPVTGDAPYLGLCEVDV